MQKDLMTPLYTHRKVLGVIGICHGPASQDVKEAYELFDRTCRWVHDAHCQPLLLWYGCDAEFEVDHPDKI